MSPESIRAKVREILIEEHPEKEIIRQIVAYTEQLIRISGAKRDKSIMVDHLLYVVELNSDIMGHDVVKGLYEPIIEMAKIIDDLEAC